MFENTRKKYTAMVDSCVISNNLIAKLLLGKILTGSLLEIDLSILLLYSLHIDLRDNPRQKFSSVEARILRYRKNKEHKMNTKFVGELLHQK